MEQEGLLLRPVSLSFQNAPICSMGSCVQWLLWQRENLCPHLPCGTSEPTGKEEATYKQGWRCTLTVAKGVDYAAVYSRLSPLSCLIIEGNQTLRTVFLRLSWHVASDSASKARGTCGDVDKWRSYSLHTCRQQITSSNTGSQWHVRQVPGPPCAAQHTHRNHSGETRLLHCFSSSRARGLIVSAKLRNTFSPSCSSSPASTLAINSCIWWLLSRNT